MRKDEELHVADCTMQIAMYRNNKTDMGTIRKYKELCSIYRILLDIIDIVLYTIGKHKVQ
jgi:hypothetical protein